MISILNIVVWVFTIHLCVTAINFPIPMPTHSTWKENLCTCNISNIKLNETCWSAWNTKTSKKTEESDCTDIDTKSVCSKEKCCFNLSDVNTSYSPNWMCCYYSQRIRCLCDSLGDQAVVIKNDTQTNSCYSSITIKFTNTRCSLQVNQTGIFLECSYFHFLKHKLVTKRSCGFYCEFIKCLNETKKDKIIKCLKTLLHVLQESSNTTVTPTPATSSTSTSSTSLLVTSRTSHVSTTSTQTTTTSSDVLTSTLSLHTTSALASSKSEQSADSPKSTVIGGAVGAVLGVAVVVAVVVWIVRRRKYRRQGQSDSRIYQDKHNQKQGNGVHNLTYNTNTDDDLEKPTYEYIDIEGNGNYEEPVRVKSYPLGKDVDVSTGNEHDVGATSVYSVLSDYQHNYLELQPELPLDNTYNTLEEDNNVAISHNVYNRINRSDLETPTDCTDAYDHALPNARNDVNATSDEYNTLKTNEEPNTLPSEYFTLETSGETEVQDGRTDPLPSKYFTLETSGETEVQDGRTDDIPSEYFTLENSDETEVQDGRTDDIPSEYFTLENSDETEVQDGRIDDIPSEYFTLENSDETEVQDGRTDDIPSEYFTLENSDETEVQDDRTDPLSSE